MVGPHVRPRQGGSPGPDVGRVDQWLRDEPAFQVMTVDGLGWICPFTATVIPAPFGFRQPAREWLVKQRPWQNGQALSLNDVQVRRWEHWLKAALPKPENEWLRCFIADGRWLNPFTGEFLPNIVREAGRITRDTVRSMAVALRGCPQAQGGQPLARELLLSRIRDASPQTPSGRQNALTAPPTTVATPSGKYAVVAPSPARSAATPTPTGGERIVHGYRIIDQLGEGAMGTVYKAVQISLQREVALKVIPQVEGEDRRKVERFLREARAAARINHPNVVACYDVGEAGQRLYMAMELVTGGDAESLARANGGALDESRALEIARDCAAGIEGVARAGLVHRDVKPANIFIAADGVAKLGDLGLVRDAGQTHRTNDGTLVGTPVFMAPEQAKGDDDLDVRADLYSLGASLYWLLSGVPPFDGESVFAVMHAVVNVSPPDIRDSKPGISPATAALVSKAMAKDRDDRFQTAREMMAAIDEAQVLLEGDTVHDHEPSGAQPVQVDVSAGDGPEIAAVSARWRSARTPSGWMVVAVPEPVAALLRPSATDPQAALAAVLPGSIPGVAVALDLDGSLRCASRGGAGVLILGDAIMARRPAMNDRLAPGETLIVLLGGDARRAASLALAAPASPASAAGAVGALASCLAMRLPPANGQPSRV